MKTFKTWDFWFNLMLIIGCTIFGLIKRDESILMGYFLVGGWQIISMSVHAVNHWFTQKGGNRFYYHWWAAGTISTALLGFVFPFDVIIWYLLLLLFVTPAMAIYYCFLCYRERFQKMERPLAQLK